MSYSHGQSTRPGPSPRSSHSRPRSQRMDGEPSPPGGDSGEKGATVSEEALYKWEQELVRQQQEGERRRRRGGGSHSEDERWSTGRSRREHRPVSKPLPLPPRHSGHSIATIASTSTIHALPSFPTPPLRSLHSAVSAPLPPHPIRPGSRTNHPLKVGEESTTLQIFTASPPRAPEKFLSSPDGRIAALSSPSPVFPPPRSAPALAMASPSISLQVPPPRKSSRGAPPPPLPLSTNSYLPPGPYSNSSFQTSPSNSTPIHASSTPSSSESSRPLLSPALMGGGEAIELRKIKSAGSMKWRDRSKVWEDDHARGWPSGLSVRVEEKRESVVEFGALEEGEKERGGGHQGGWSSLSSGGSSKPLIGQDSFAGSRPPSGERSVFPQRSSSGGGAGWESAEGTSSMPMPTPVPFKSSAGWDENDHQEELLSLKIPGGSTAASPAEWKREKSKLAEGSGRVKTREDEEMGNGLRNSLPHSLPGTEYTDRSSRALLDSDRHSRGGRLSQFFGGGGGGGSAATRRESLLPWSRWGGFGTFDLFSITSAKAKEEQRLPTFAEREAERRRLAEKERRREREMTRTLSIHIRRGGTISSRSNSTKTARRGKQSRPTSSSTKRTTLEIRLPKNRRSHASRPSIGTELYDSGEDEPQAAIRSTRSSQISLGVSLGRTSTRRRNAALPPLPFNASILALNAAGGVFHSEPPLPNPDLHHRRFSLEIDAPRPEEEEVRRRRRQGTRFSSLNIPLAPRLSQSISNIFHHPPKPLSKDEAGYQAPYNFEEKDDEASWPRIPMVSADDGRPLHWWEIHPGTNCFPCDGRFVTALPPPISIKVPGTSDKAWEVRFPFTFFASFCVQISFAILYLVSNAGFLAARQPFLLVLLVYVHLVSFSSMLATAFSDPGIR